MGRATAEALASKGYGIVLSSRAPQAAAEEIARQHGVPVLAVAGSIADPATATALVAAAEPLGGIDALLINHGGPPVRPVMDTGDVDWQEAFEMMVQGPMRLLRAVVPLMRARGGGRVLGVSSFTVKSPQAGIILSNSLRAALVNALKTAAQEFGPDNILINALAPGYVATERLVGWNHAYAEARGTTPEEVAKATLATIPLRRTGEAADFGRFAAFLLSDENAYISGQQILFDGALVVAN